MTGTPNALQDVIELRQKLEARLHNNPDYIAMQELDQVISRLGGSSSFTQHVEKAATSEIRPSVRAAKVDQRDASIAAIKARGTPMSTDELIPAVEDAGCKLSGKKNINLSSALSRDERFVSVSWRGRKWWLKGLPLPSEGGPLQTDFQTNSAPLSESGAVSNPA